MMLSIELVPREIGPWLQQAREFAARFDQFGWLNIPDIRTLPVRSDEAAEAGLDLPYRLVPHVRARDRSPAESVALLQRLERAGLRDALIVTGDRYDQSADAGHATSLDVLRAAKEAGVGLTLWAAFDPYRGEMRAELEYARAKLEAGAAGLFTQPFFDARLAEICLEQLSGIPTFVGITPVTTERSRAYWERTNRVVFPPRFQATMEYCAALGRDLLDIASAHGQHAYVMPIRVDAVLYVDALLSGWTSPRAAAPPAAPSSG